MATFKFGRTVDIHWNGYDIVGPADTVFSIPDQLYEEFDSDIAPVEPTLVWLDTNEFQTLQNSVPNYSLAATSPIAIASSTNTGGAVTKTWSLNANYSTSTHNHDASYQPSGTYVNKVIASSPASVLTSSGTATVSISSGTNPNGYLLTADGTGGVIFTPASTSGLTSVVGVSPISSIISGGTVSVSLNASYQTAGTYVTSVTGSSPVSASGTTAVTVSINQSLLSVADADTAETLRTYVKNSSGGTISKGQVVYLTGSDGTNALIGLSTASTEAGSSKTLGIAANTMTNNAFGYVIENGQLAGIDTSATTAGASVWLGNTPGALVFGAPPAEPSHSVYLGVVTKANASTGEILVKVQNGYELNELHDVFTNGVSTALPLVYSSTSSGWVAQALDSVGIADNAIVAAKINAGAVTSAKIGDNAVVEAKINAGAVTSAKIADNAVVAAKIAAAVVGTSKFDSGAAANGTVLTANGSGAASFQAASSGSTWYEIASEVNGSAISLSEGTYMINNLGVSPSRVVSTAGVTTYIPSERVIKVNALSSLSKVGIPAGTEFFQLPLTQTFNTNIIGIAASENGYVAVHERDKLYYSPDGKTWYETAKSPTTASSVGMHYAGGKFILSISGTTSTVAYSTDGITWTDSTVGAINSLGTKFAYDGVNYYVCGAAGKIARTSDFSTWTITTPSSSTHAYNSIAYGNNSTLVAVGNAGIIVTSINSGSTATIRTSTATADFNDIVWDSVNSVFVATTRGAGPIVLTSPDGITWTDRTPSGYTSDTRILATSNGVSIAIQASNTSTIYSTNGITWSRFNPGIGNILFISANSTEFIGVVGAATADKYFAVSPTKSELLFQKVTSSTA